MGDYQKARRIIKEILGLENRLKREKKISQFCWVLTQDPDRLDILYKNVLEGLVPNFSDLWKWYRSFSETPQGYAYWMSIISTYAWYD
jgi:hypothetical protein